MKKRHPMQPVVWDDQGVIRFQANPIVRHLLDHGGIDLNKLAMLAEPMGWTRGDQEQFAQLIGYSIGGFGELSYVRDSTYEKAVAKRDALFAKHPQDPRTPQAVKGASDG